MNEMVSNPFGSTEVAAIGDALTSSEEARAIQEVQAAMVIAKKFPRNSLEAMDRIINSCTRPTLANTAVYCYPKGGQNVSGPSIRLAEAIAQQWGNIQYGIRELSTEKESSLVETYAWDIETNTKQVKVFRVGHHRFARGKLKLLTDPRDIYEMIANMGARRLRACILGVIPGDVTEAALTQCKITQESAVDASPDNIRAWVQCFYDKFGVTAEMIEERIGRRVSAIHAHQLLGLMQVHQSIVDGMGKPDQFFNMELAEPQPTESAIALTPAEPPPDDYLVAQKDTYNALIEVMKNASATNELDGVDVAIETKLTGKARGSALSGLNRRLSQLRLEELRVGIAAETALSGLQAFNDRGEGLQEAELTQLQVLINERAKELGGGEVVTP